MTSEDEGRTQRHRVTEAVLDSNQITGLIIEAGMEIHKELGPGLLESVYETVLVAELKRRGLRVDRQVELPVTWKGEVLDHSFRLDLVVEGRIVVELKSVERTIPVHKKQLLTYLKLSGYHLGLLMNFGQATLKDGIERVIWGDL